MAKDVGGDQLAIIRIEGMHCHKCEAAIRTSLQRVKGVNEVEVDFASRQASVLFDPSQVKLTELMRVIDAAGYSATSMMTNSGRPSDHNAQVAPAGSVGSE